MTADIAPVEAPGQVYRVARQPDAFVLPSWEYANSTDGTFGGRYDDPRGEYRVLYVATTRVGAFCEKLAALRPALDVLGAIEALAGRAEAAEAFAATLPPRWVQGRVIGRAAPAGFFADIGHSSTIEALRSRLGQTAASMGLDDLDASTIRLGRPRRLTQLVSRLVYDQTTGDGAPRFAGLAYRSRLGDDLLNLAVFERRDVSLPLSEMSSAAIDPDDPDLSAALELLGLTHGQ